MQCLQYFCYTVFVVLLISMEYFATKVRQEGAVVNICNPKYMKDCYSMTRRPRRGEPYKTNITGVNLHPWYNNVTFKIILYPDGIPMVLVNQRCCDIMRVDWLIEYIRTYSNETNICPFLPGFHALINMEFPPKHFPEAFKKLLQGRAEAYVMLTKTEELIFKGTIRLF